MKAQASETNKIRERYERRKKHSASTHSRNGESVFVRYARREREKVYQSLIAKKFTDLSSLKVLEIGAGHGIHVNFFHQMGIPYTGIYANELLADRCAKLRQKYPQIHLLPGDALQLDYHQKFDVVFQSLVFSSILDDSFRVQLAKKMWSMKRPDGILIWYDFVYNNPFNKDVKRVRKSEIKSLFGQAKKIEFHSVTLAPPIARRVGNWYPLMNWMFPALRTHKVALIC